MLGATFEVDPFDGTQGGTDAITGFITSMDPLAFSNLFHSISNEFGSVAKNSSVIYFIVFQMVLYYEILKFMFCSFSYVTIGHHNY